MLNKNHSNRRLQSFLVCIFVVLTFALFFLLDTVKKHQQQQHLELVTERYQLAYKTIYDQYKLLAVTLHSGLVKQYNLEELYTGLLTADKDQKDTFRQEWASRLMPRYTVLQQTAHLRQLHLHLPNNESFLRLHRPEKFGDNLAGIRRTVEYVNREHTAIDGFEEGRINNGYRFVFPVTATDTTHLGSIEISFGADAFTSAMMKQYAVLSNFFIKETSVNNAVFPDELDKTYRQSHHPGYLFDKNVLAELKKISRKEIQELRPCNHVVEKVAAEIRKGSTISTFDPSIKQIITTIPVFHPLTSEMEAFFTIRSKADFLMDEGKQFKTIFLLSSFLLATILLVFYLQQGKKSVLENTMTHWQQERDMFSQGSVMTFVWQNSENFPAEHVSENVMNILGYSPLEFLDGNVQYCNIIHPDDQRQVSAEVSTLTRKKENYFTHKPYRLITRTGGIVWVLNNTSLVRDSKNEISHFYGYLVDITATVYLEQEVGETKDRLLAIAENVPGVIFQFYVTNSGESGFHYVSPKLLDIFGFTYVDDSTLFSETFVQNIHKDDRQSWKNSIQNAVEQQSLWEWKGRYVMPSGYIIWFEGRSTPTARQDEIVFDGIFTDITEKMEQEEQRLESSQQKEQLEKLESLKTMAGAIAHRFNNAMMAVQGNLELIMCMLPADSNEYKMASNAARAANGASQVGSMMLSYVGKQKLNCQESSFESVVIKSITTLKELLLSPVSLEFIPPEKPLFCVMDPKRIQEVIVSIVTNAAESLSYEQGMIEISFGIDHFTEKSFPVTFQNDKLTSGTYAYCQIKDSGHGISPKNLLRIFEPFYTTRFVGRGLGLALTVGIMQSHHGALIVESEEDCGTTVKVLLPSIVPTQQISPSAAVALSLSRDMVQLSGDILLVDDEGVILDIGLKMLEAIGFTVHTATNGREAEEIVRENATGFVAVVMDISMPEMDGIEAMAAIRKINPALPVLLSSGYSEEVFRFNENRSASPDGFLGKPFRLSDMQSSLETLLS